MHSIALAMVWEYWRKALWRNLIGLVMGGAALVLMPFHGALPAELVTSGPFSIVMILIAVVGFTTIELTEYDTSRDRLGFPLHLYAKPVSTAWMVGLRMLLTVATAIAIYLGLGLLVWLMSGTSLRLLEPVLFLVVIAVWTDAAIWSLSGSPLLQLLGLAIGYVFGVSLYAEHIVESNAASQGVFDTLRLLSALPATGLAYAVAVIAVGYDRHGARLSLARVVAWIGKQVYAMRREDRTFRSAGAAQFWLEWHRKGLVLPGLNLLVIAVYAGLAILTEEVALEDGLAFLWGLAFVNILLFPILVAMAVNARDRSDSQDLFWGTRPLSDNVLLLVRLRVAAAGLLAGWGVWLAGLMAISGLSWATGQSEGLTAYVERTIGERLPVRVWLLYAAMVGLNTWTVMGIVGSLQATGRKPVAALWISLPVVLAAWQVLVARGIMPRGMVEAVQVNVPWTLGLLCLLLTGLAYAVALRRKRITGRFAWICLGLYLALSLWVLLLPMGLGEPLIHVGTSLLVLTLGLCTLPLLPLALGPLAIAWNRHR